MKAIYLDAFSGISGNMLLGAFLQAGVPERYLRAELSKLPLDGEYAIDISSVQKNGIVADYVAVKGAGETAHEHGAADHAATEPSAAHAQDEHHAHEHHHPHRTFASIQALIDGSTLAPRVRETALKIFTVLAEAEGHVHGRPAAEVAFHEVGAVDSIIDIVGTAIALDYLGMPRVYASALNLGSGFVHCAHGVIPVPAPAVAELLRDWPTYAEGDRRELTTPTGAAVVRALAEYAPALPRDFHAEHIGYGAGTWELSIPNVLRLYLGETEGNRAGDEAKYLLAANIDDMNPQIYGYLTERLFAAGALDVWLTPIYMKKNRPASELKVLVNEAQKAACTRLIFRETTTIGLRVLRLDDRIACTRRIARVETKYGEVGVKVAAYEGEIVSAQPEYEDAKKLAAAKDVPLKLILDEAKKEIAFRLG